MNKTIFSIVCATCVGGALGYLDAQSHVHAGDIRALNGDWLFGVGLGFGMVCTLVAFVPIRIAAHYLWRAAAFGSNLADYRRRKAARARTPSGLF